MPEPEEIRVIYLTTEDLLVMCQRAGIGPLRDIGLLDSAAGRPRSSVFGADAYPSLELKTAALVHSLARNHPLVDGNKRLAWLAAVTFADINAYAPNVSDDEAFELVMSVARGELDVEAIAAALHLRPCPSAEDFPKD